MQSSDPKESVNELLNSSHTSAGQQQSTAGQPINQLFSSQQISSQSIQSIGSHPKPNQSQVPPQPPPQQQSLVKSLVSTSNNHLRAKTLYTFDGKEQDGY